VTITKEKIIDKLSAMFQEEWYTNKSEYQDENGDETKEFKELQEIETKVFEIIKEHYEKI